jgi:hypothetical protein
MSTRRKHPKRPWPKEKRLVANRPGDPMRGLTPSEVADSARLPVAHALNHSDWGRWRIVKRGIFRLWWGT